MYTSTAIVWVVPKSFFLTFEVPTYLMKNTKRLSQAEYNGSK